MKQKKRFPFAAVTARTGVVPREAIRAPTQEPSAWLPVEDPLWWRLRSLLEAGTAVPVGVLAHSSWLEGLSAGQLCSSTERNKGANRRTGGHGEPCFLDSASAAR